ncbi:28S ribosomal protein S27 mitochondrial [Biomphalaria pfeifferi]|uniref:28S ribosomal protein S27 mitochondrial n=1 Tax=Biomphalaria pfeifferi TaxID=112525 RepID=A0AAD8B969_BIOPF|nr:28S ribosomal protein S27 mitochondrial [Biomphalaria pfeifferi]
MASSLRLFQRVVKQIHCYQRNAVSLVCKRHLLSEAYSCKEAWKKYCEDPILSKESPTDFAYQIRDRLEKSGHVSAVDVNILAHYFHSMDEEEIEFMEDILSKFNFCQSSYPRNDCTSHAIAMGFLTAGHSKSLLNMLTDTKNYGIIPHHITLNMILDWFIKQEEYGNAAKLAYGSMLQEDFSNPVNTLLSLHATVHYLLQSKIEDLASPPKEKDTGEEVWVKVKYIKFPYYDDHFDIRDERFLLGKTLMLLADAQSVPVPSELRIALKVTGSGLFHKFPQGLACLNSMASSDDASVPEVALIYFSDCLEKVEARDPNEPEVELALRTIDDVIHRLLPTTDEKQKYISELAQIKESLEAKGKILKDFDFKQSVVNFVSQTLSSYENADISTLKSLFNQWTEERKQEVNREIEEFQKNTRIEEMKKQVKELQEQEELLRYFDLEEKLRLKFLDEDRATDKGLTISK